MATYNLKEDVDRKLRMMAEQQHRSPEEVLGELVEQKYAVSSHPYPRVTPPDPDPRPASSLTDKDIDLPDWIRAEDRPKFYTAERQIRPKLYRIARRYWEQVGDAERLALTDVELDKQFWLIDQDGIPRLKSEKGSVRIADSPFEEMAKQAYLSGQGSGRSDISENFDDVLRETLAEKLSHPHA